MNDELKEQIEILNKKLEGERHRSEEWRVKAEAQLVVTNELKNTNEELKRKLQKVIGLLEKNSEDNRKKQHIEIIQNRIKLRTPKVLNKSQTTKCLKGNEAKKKAEMFKDLVHTLLN